jgi:uncharacterized membrane protein
MGVPVDGILRPSRRRRRGGALLELVLTIPVSVALVFLSIDVGRLVLVKSYLHDAAAVAARAGARTGDLGTVDDVAGETICTDAGARNSNVYRSFCEAASSIPGGDVESFRLRLTNQDGEAANGATYCQGGYLYVEVTTTGTVDYLTDVFKKAGGVVGLEFPGFGDIPVTAVAVARCEVAY